MSSHTTKRIVKCPNCGQAVHWTTDNPFRPFCSERCKQIDLGAWASESYRVAATDAENFSADTDTDKTSQ